MSGKRNRANILIDGIVQGVFFRSNAKEMANSLSITGWIKNLEGGNVQAVVEGSKDLIDQFIEWCNKGTSMAKVTKVTVEWQDATDEFSSFEINY